MKTSIMILLTVFLFSCATFQKEEGKKYVVKEMFDGQQEIVVKELAWAISERAVLTNICGYNWMNDGTYEGVKVYHLYVDAEECVRGYLTEKPVKVSPNLPATAETHKKYFLESIKEAGGVDKIIKMFSMKERGMKETQGEDCDMRPEETVI